jgi:hypothetical protein
MEGGNGGQREASTMQRDAALVVDKAITNFIKRMMAAELPWMIVDASYNIASA